MGLGEYAGGDEAGRREVKAVMPGQTLTLRGDSRCHTSECKGLSISELLPAGFPAGPHTAAARGLCLQKLTFHTPTECIRGEHVLSGRPGSRFV